jgi:hypothetical protein
MGRLLLGVGLCILLLGGVAIFWFLHHANREHGESASFEIREVRCSETTDDSSWLYSCQGTLLTRDIRYQNNEIVVWYQDVSKRSGDKSVGSPLLQYVRMSKGVATLTSGAYYSRKHAVGTLTFGDYAADPGPPEPEWNVLGFSRLEPANVSVQK